MVRAAAAALPLAEMNLSRDNFPRAEWKARPRRLLRASVAKALPLRRAHQIEDPIPSRDKPRMLAYAVHRR